MDDFYQRPLQYGHLGTANYVQELQTWEFPRRPGKGVHLSPVGEAKTILDFKDRLVESGSRAAVSSERDQESAFFSRHPELAPGFDFIRPYKTTSQAIASVVDDLEPVVSSHLAVGSATRSEHGRATRETVPVVVTVCDGSTINFKCTESSSNEDMDLTEVGDSAANSHISWISSDAPVQGLYFADVLDEPSVYLAVRHALFTTIYRPLYHRTPVLIGRPNQPFIGDLPRSSLLDPNHVVDIASSLTGGHPHAAIAFNPWYQEQIAIVDCVGNWSLWDLVRKTPRKSGWIAKPGPSGSLQPPCSKKDSESSKQDHYDGWGAVSWAADVQQLLVCDRQNLNICRIVENSSEQHSIDLDLRRSEWILSICRSKKNSSHMFILTTIRVFWLHISPEPDHNGQNYSVLLSWEHYRDLEDTSLQLASVPINEGVLLIISSRLNLLSQVYRASFSPEDPSVPVSISDPSIILLPSKIVAPNLPKGEPAHPRYFSSLIFEAASSPLSEEDGSLSSHLRFIGRGEGLGVVECLYSIELSDPPENESIGHFDDDQLEMSHLDKKTRRQRESDFVVSDGSEPVQLVNGHMLQRNLPSPAISWSVEVPAYIEQWEPVHSLLSTIGGSTGRESTFSSWLEVARGRVLNAMSNRSTTVHTLLDITLSPITIEDVDHDSYEFGEAFQPAEVSSNGLLSQSQTMRFPIIYPSRSTLFPDQDVNTNISLSELYDSLIRDWLSPLSNRIPNRIRASKERIIRTITTNLMLSSITILPETPDQEQSQSQSQSQSQINTLGDEDLNTQASEPASSTLNELTLNANSNLSTLRKYTTVKRDLTTTKRASITLTHWNAGGDPYAYNWQNTKASEQEAHYSENESGARRRRKARKQNLRKSSIGSSGLRASIGIASSQVATPASNTPMPIDKPWGSQPEVNPNSQASQGVGIGFPMSQMERGLFGGRDTRRKSALGGGKKPKRVAGF